MVQINSWMSELTDKLKSSFGMRLIYVGLQGSYRRGEATERSDIDAVVILDALTTDDMMAYRQVIDSMPEHEKACGFFSGRQELMNWPRHELFQFKNDTVDLYGSLDALLPEITGGDIIDSVRNGASALYHGCCHTFLHADKSNLADALQGFYKGAFFILQALHYLRNDVYVGSKRELLTRLEGTEKELLRISMDWDACVSGIAADPAEYYEKITGWCAAVLAETVKKEEDNL